MVREFCSIHCSELGSSGLGCSVTNSRTHKPSRLERNCTLMRPYVIGLRHIQFDGTNRCVVAVNTECMCHKRHNFPPLLRPFWINHGNKCSIQIARMIRWWRDLACKYSKASARSLRHSASTFCVYRILQ